MKTTSRKFVCPIVGLLLAANQINAQSLDFTNGIWDFSASGGSSSSTGWSSPSYSKGTTEVLPGIFATVTFSQHGASINGNGNLSYTTDNSFNGFNVHNHADYDDPDATTTALSDYQRIQIVFSSALMVDYLTFDDIDRQSGWADALAIEAFPEGGGYSFANGHGPDSFMMGGNLRYLEGNGSTLFTSQPGLDYFSADTGGNGIMDPANRLTVSWASPISEVDLYFFDSDPANSGTTDHGISLLGNVMAPVPEPSSMCLVMGAGGLALLRRKRAK